MEYIIKEIPECEMKIISNTRNIYGLEKILNDLTINKNVKFYDIPQLLKSTLKKQVCI